MRRPKSGGTGVALPFFEGPLERWPESIGRQLGHAFHAPAFLHATARAPDARFHGLTVNTVRAGKPHLSTSIRRHDWTSQGHGQMQWPRVIRDDRIGSL